MAKIVNDKYYTPKDLAEYCVNKTKEIIGEDNITEWLEPSGGNGVFLDFLPQGTYSCDIEPEDDRIVRQDYLKLDLEYKKGRCIIGNPPFGEKNTLSVKFYNKSVELGDYIVFILPISQYKNNQQMYKFDMIYSEDLGKRFYTDRDIHCCLNIYRRNENGKLNKKEKISLKDIELKENRRTGQQLLDFKYDIGICSFGAGIIGRQPQYVGQYAKEFYFKINNKSLKDKIIEVIVNADWEKDVCGAISGQSNLAQWQVYKYLKEQIPELE